MKRTNIAMEAYQYELPPARIAPYPLDKRDGAKLLLYREGKMESHFFRELPALLPKDPWLVFNNTRVIQARMKFYKATGAQIEVFCIEPEDPADYEMAFQSTSQLSWTCMVGNARKWKTGPVYLNARVHGLDLKLEACLLERRGQDFLIRFSWDQPGISFGEIIEHCGTTPIPPYLNREAKEEDRFRYQTVYSQINGSVAAPTAGLHFTKPLLKELESSGTRMSNLTLHVGAGTFVPVKERNARQHRMHSEMVLIEGTFLKEWKADPGRLVAVGTTSTRSLESLYWLGIKLKVQPGLSPEKLKLEQWENEGLPQNISLDESIGSLLDYMHLHQLDLLSFHTQLMIVPGYRFRCINGLITNFHLPGSTLLLLIAAFIGEDWKELYRYALENGYRFLSYGDSSLLIPRRPEN